MALCLGLRSGGDRGRIPGFQLGQGVRRQEPVGAVCCGYDRCRHRHASQAQHAWTHGRSARQRQRARADWAGRHRRRAFWLLWHWRRLSHRARTGGRDGHADDRRSRKLARRRRRIWHDHRTELRAYRSGQLEARGSFRRCRRGWRYCRCSNFDEAGQLSWSSEHGICSTDLHYCRIHAVEGELTGCAPDHSRALIASAALQRL